MARFTESYRFNMTPELKAKLNATAEAEGRKKSEIIREVLWEYVKDVEDDLDAELAQVRERLDEIPEERTQHQEALEELEEEREELKKKEQRLAEKNNEISQTVSYEDSLDRIRDEALQKENASVSKHWTIIEDAATKHRRTESQVVQDLYEKRPVLVDAEFHDREIQPSWSREYDDYDTALDTLKYRAEYDVGIYEKAEEIANHFDVEKNVQTDEIVTSTDVVLADAVDVYPELDDEIDKTVLERVEVIRDARTDS